MEEDYSEMGCEHIKALYRQLKELKIEIYSEHGDDGWVNVYCRPCSCIEEMVLPKVEGILLT